MEGASLPRASCTAEGAAAAPMSQPIILPAQEEEGEWDPFFDDLDTTSALLETCASALPALQQEVEQKTLCLRQLGAANASACFLEGELETARAELRVQKEVSEVYCLYSV